MRKEVTAMVQEAYVTFGANDSSALGCLVLGYSLRKHGTARTLVALVTEDLNPTIRSLMSDVFDLVQSVPKLKMIGQQSPLSRSLPEANISVTKINCWYLTQFTKCIFLEADSLVLQNCDELFERAELSAVPDVGWPDCFNSGVFVFVPSLHTYYALIDILRHDGSFDGSDQGLLNCYFGKEWQLDISKRLPFIYNMMSSSSYTYAPAYQQFGKNSKIVRFMGYPKPWSIPWNAATGKIQSSIDNPHQGRLLQEWLDIFLQNVLTALPEQCHRKAKDKETITAWDFQCFLKCSSIKKIIHERPHNYLQVEENHPSIASGSTYQARVNPLAIPNFTEQMSAVYLPPQAGEDNDTKYTLKKDQISKSIECGSIQNKKCNACATKGSEYSDQPVAKIRTVPLNSSFPSQTEPQETTNLASLASEAIAEATETEALLPEEIDQLRLQEWEEGNMDYQGRDSFDNIWRHLLHFIEDIPTSDEEVSITHTSDKLTIDHHTSSNGDVPAGSSSSHTEAEQSIPGYPLGDYTGMQRWEQGNIDYAGIDSSDSIMRRLDYLISGMGFLSDQS